jgi:hypothetical protein
MYTLTLQGRMYAVPVVLTVLALVFYHIAAFGCKSFKIDTGTGFYKFGYWSASAGRGRGCVQYVGEVSGILKFGRFLGVMGALLIWPVFAAVLVGLFSQYTKPKVVFPIVGSCMGLLSFFSFLLLVGLRDDSSAKLSGGGAVAISAAFCWAAAAHSMFVCMNECPVAQASTITAVKKPTHRDPEHDITENTE